MTEQRRPRVGDRVRYDGVVWSRGELMRGEGTVSMTDGSTHPIRVGEYLTPNDIGWFRECDVTLIDTPLPAAPEPRPDWEVLREAADIASYHLPLACSVEGELRALSARLEAAARPKPTLAEAVRAYSDAFHGPCTCGAERTAMFEALARETAKGEGT